MILLKLIWLFGPAGIANMAPPFAALWFPRFNQPMDFGKTFRGKRILGDHKTIRGFVVGVLLAGLFFFLQKFLVNRVEFFQKISLVDYNNLPWYFGFLLGVGALGGDVVKSFFKRQIGIASGKTWFPWDQLDWVLGTVLVLLLFVRITLVDGLFILSLGLILHLIIKAVGYLVRINKTMI